MSDDDGVVGKGRGSDVRGMREKDGTNNTNYLFNLNE